MAILSLHDVVPRLPLVPTDEFLVCGGVGLLSAQFPG